MKTLVWGFAFFLMVSTAQANCSSPSGTAGTMEWLPGLSKVEFCDGTNWQDTSNATGASCSGVVAGTITSVSGVVSYCNGSNWISMQGANVGAAGGALAGTFSYNSVSQSYNYSDGTYLYSMKASTGPTLPSLNLLPTQGWNVPPQGYQYWNTISWAAPSTGSYECRIGTTATYSSLSWVPCRSGWSFGPSKYHDHDGGYVFQIHSLDNYGNVMATHTYPLYFHWSLSYATKCNNTFTDAQIETAARTYLSASGAFSLASNLIPPRIQLITSDSVVHESRTLRRKFGMSSDGEFAWISRIYTSTTYGGCKVQQHLTDMTCDVVATNAAFDSVCLNWNGSSFTFGEYESSQNTQDLFNTAGTVPANDTPSTCTADTLHGSAYLAKGRSESCKADYSNHKYMTVYFIPD